MGLYVSCQAYLPMLGYSRRVMPEFEKAILSFPATGRTSLRAAAEQAPATSFVVSLPMTRSLSAGSSANGRPKTLTQARTGKYNKNHTNEASMLLKTQHRPSKRSEDCTQITLNLDANCARFASHPATSGSVADGGFCGLRHFLERRGNPRTAKAAVRAARRKSRANSKMNERTGNVYENKGSG